MEGAVVSSGAGRGRPATQEPKINLADPLERSVKRRGGITRVRELHPIGRGHQQSGQRPRMLWVHDFEMHFPVVGRHDNLAVVHGHGAGGRIIPRLERSSLTVVVRFSVDTVAAVLEPLYRADRGRVEHGALFAA